MEPVAAIQAKPVINDMVVPGVIICLRGSHDVRSMSSASMVPQTIMRNMMAGNMGLNNSGHRANPLHQRAEGRVSRAIDAVLENR